MTTSAPTPRPIGRLLICLAGGRPDAAVFTAQHYDPDEVIIVHSATAPKSAAELRDALREATPRAVCAYARPAHPYRTTDTAVALAGLLQELQPAEVAISLTGAPMPMGIAAYQFARDRGLSAFYLDTGSEQMYDLASDTPAQPVRLRLTVAQFLRQRGCELDERHNPDLMRDGGHAFEREIWEAACAMRDHPAHADAEPFFEDCRMSAKFRISDAEREIDLFCIRHGVATIASCKTGRGAFIKEHLDVLNAVAEKLGARYCTRLYLVGEPRPAPPPRHRDPFELFLMQADSASTVVVTRAGEGFCVQRPAGQPAAEEGEPITDILRREALTPTYQRR